MCPGQDGPSGSSVYWEKCIALAYSKNLAAYSHWIEETEGKGGDRAANYHLCYDLTETETPLSVTHLLKGFGTMSLHVSEKRDVIPGRKESWCHGKY